jgi:hypothetical protein
LLKPHPAKRFIMSVGYRPSSPDVAAPVHQRWIQALHSSRRASLGADIDYGQLLKIYGKPDDAGPDWYGPAKVIETVPTPISGDTKLERISTSHIERANLSFRTQLRRFTRLALGFSKKLQDLKAAVSFYVAYYNLCRVHRTLRVTPAMEAGLTSHVWSIKELLQEGMGASSEQAA